MNMRQQTQKPGIAEWARAAEILADRLTECVHVYKRNVDVFMAEAERQRKTDLTIKTLQKLHALLDQIEGPEELVSDVPKHDERIIGGLEAVFHEALKALPWISADMQKLLKSPWMKGFPGKAAKILFWGEGAEQEGKDKGTGIGSGLPEDGRLPGLLSALLEREEMGEIRPPRDLLSGEPQRHDVEGRVRWAQQNSGYLRSAGKVE